MRVLIAIGVRRAKEAGAAGVVVNHASELQRLGHEVECWFLDDILPLPARSKRFESILFAIAVAQKILQQRNKFDVVNVHAPCGCAYGVWRKCFRPKNSPPYVLTMHGSEERYVATMKREHRKGRAWHFSWKNRIWHRLYHHSMYKCSIICADQGVVVNREAWIMAQLKYGCEPARWSFVPNGVEEKFLASAAARTYGQHVRLLYVGTWLDRKGVYYLADAFLLASKRIPGLALTVAGCLASVNEVRSYFADEVRNRVGVVPFVPRENMPDLYLEHDIFVFPSLVEGMPLTLLEAMATGMPVVTTNTCGMADLVENGVNGLLVPPADGRSMAIGLDHLCGSAELREGLGAAAHVTAKRYTWKNVTRQLEAVLRAAVEGEHNQFHSGSGVT